MVSDQQPNEKIAQKRTKQKSVAHTVSQEQAPGHPRPHSALARASLLCFPQINPGVNFN